MMSEFFLFYKEHIGVQVPSSARKTQVERLESFYVIGKTSVLSEVGILTYSIADVVRGIL